MLGYLLMSLLFYSGILCHFIFYSVTTISVNGTHILCVTGASVDSAVSADLKLAFAALTTTLFEAAKIDKDEVSLRYFLC